MAHAAARMADSTLRFSDVAHFVGLSLLRDPKPLTKKPKALVTKKLVIPKEYAGQMQSASALPTTSRAASMADAEQSHSRPSMEKSHSLPSLPTAESPKANVRRSPKLRPGQSSPFCVQDQVFKVERQREQDAQKQTEKTRERCHYHKRRLQYVDDTIASLERELQAGEEAALKAELQRELQRKLRPRQEVPIVVPSGAMATSEDPSRGIAAGDPEPDDVADEDELEAAKAADAYLAAADTEEPAAVPTINVLDTQQVLENGEREQGGGSSASSASRLTFDVHFKADSLGTDPQEGIVKNARTSSNGSKDTIGHVSSKGESSHTSSKPLGILKESGPGETIVTPDVSMFHSEKELLQFQQDVIRRELIKSAGSAMQAFKSINLNGSGNICSQEFADGVKRLGIPWEQLTGLRAQRLLFRMFDVEKTGVITFFELFPTERNKPRDNSGMTTPEFWKSWVNQNRGMDTGCGGAKWQAGTPEDHLALALSAADKGEASLAHHKWISKTFRRMKFSGKSDARCREMVALHLPRGTGSEDLQGVRTFSHNEVKKCKHVYTDSVQDSQRCITKALDDLRDQRRELQHSRHQLQIVSGQGSVPVVVPSLKASLGGLHLVDKHSPDVPAPEVQLDLLHGDDSVPVQDQMSFRELSKVSGATVEQIEAVFKVWMHHADKTETIVKKSFQKLLEELCPNRTISENDFNAWWDQVHNKGYAECTSVDWTAADDKYSTWNKASLGTQGRRDLAQSRKTPATFDQFIMWWSTSEVRQT